MIDLIEERLQRLLACYRSAPKGWYNGFVVFLFAAIAAAFVCTLAVVALVERIEDLFRTNSYSGLFEILSDPYRLYPYIGMPMVFVTILTALLAIQIDRHGPERGIAPVRAIMKETGQATWQRIGLLIPVLLVIYAFLSKPLFTHDYWGEGWVATDDLYADGVQGALVRFKGWIVELLGVVNQYLAYPVAFYLVVKDRQDRGEPVTQAWARGQWGTLFFFAIMAEAIYAVTSHLLRGVVFAFIDIPFGENILFPGVFKLMAILLLGAYLLPVMLIGLTPPKEAAA